MQSQANNHKTRTIMAKFETGKTYFTRSIGDHDCIHKFEILKRTDKSVWVKVHAEIVRRAIEIHGNTEAFYPFGKHSMAATITADRPMVEEPEPEVVTNTAEAIREKRRAAIAEKTEARLERYEELAEKNARASTAAQDVISQLSNL